MVGTPPQSPKKDKKGGDGVGGSDTKGVAVFQRLVWEVGVGSSYPVLTKTNYSDWATHEGEVEGPRSMDGDRRRRRR
jgi:hypothetical protein